MIYLLWDDRVKKKLILIISIFLIGINNVYANDEVKYVNCIDGDTIRVLLNDEEKTVRLLAIDAPEDSPNRVEYYGKEASEYTCNKIKKAKKISLEYDQNSDKYDKYDRVLAWVFIDDKLLEEELVKNGYAKVAYLYNDYKYTSKLKEQEEKAKEKGIGIWNELAKEKYEASNIKDEVLAAKIDEYADSEVLILLVLYLMFVFISSKTLKRKK